MNFSSKPKNHNSAKEFSKLISKKMNSVSQASSRSRQVSTGLHQTLATRWSLGTTLISTAEPNSEKSFVQRFPSNPYLSTYSF